MIVVIIKKEEISQRMKISRNGRLNRIKGASVIIKQCLRIKQQKNRVMIWEKGVKLII